MADDGPESKSHELCASGDPCVRDDQKSQCEMRQPRQKLKDLLLSAVPNSDSGICLNHLTNRSKNVLSHTYTLNSNDSSSVAVQERSKEKIVLDYQHSEESFGPFDKFGLSSSSPWCSFSNNGTDCAKQNLISKILVGDERHLENTITECEQEGCIFDESALDPLGSKYDSGEEWEMGSSALDNECPQRQNEVESKADEFAHLDDKAMIIDRKPLQRIGVSCLLAKQQSEANDSLAQELSQVVGEHQVVECKLEEIVNKSEEHKFQLIWLKFTSPVSEDGISVLCSLRSASKRNKDSHVIVVVDKQANVDLRSKGADDVLVEPVSSEVIKKTCLKYTSLAAPIGPDTVRTHSLTVREITGTPESTISTSSKRTDLDLDRERIKDSCDQLRVLLPYVKGRKTDMASILEMTVDYLKIVSSALPEDFHSEVIEIMSTGSPLTEGQMGQTIGGMNMALAKKSTKKGSSAVRTNLEAVATCHGETNLNKRMTTRALSRAAGALESGAGLDCGNRPSGQMGLTTGVCKATKASQQSPVIVPAKREYTENANTTSASTAKRPHINLRTSQSETHSTTTEFFPARNSVMDQKREALFGDSTSNYGLQISQHFLGNESTSKRSLASSQVAMTNDTFSYGTQAQGSLQTSRLTSLDRPDLASYGGLYFDSGYYHYGPYSTTTLQDSNNGNYFLPPGANEYVNPNAVLPVTSYAPRGSSSGRKLDRIASTACRLAVDSSDVYNNNTTTNTSTNSSYHNSNPL